LKQKKGSFCFKTAMGKHAKSVDSQVLARIHRKGDGWVFTPSDFLDLGSRRAVGLALMRHTKAGTIRKLARGLYDLPRQDSRVGLVAASTEEIANALKGRDSVRLQLSGGHAANQLGISDQVPMRTVFLTDGPSRKVQLGRRQIVLKQTTPRQMATAGRISGTVIQALRWLGRQNVDSRVVAALRRNLSEADKKQLLKDLRYAPAWVAEVMREVGQRSEA
jgi:Family of unknown function (DUF6088)